MVHVHSVPTDISAALTLEVAREIAIYDDTVVFPEEVLVYEPGDGNEYFSDYPTPILVLMFENQGVCAWGVPLGVDHPPVLVGDEFGVTRFSPNIETFIAARRWDDACFSLGPTMIQAQAEPLPDVARRFLDERYESRITTHGWPGHTQLRYESGSTRIMLWLSEEQCDWFIAAKSAGELEDAMRSLIALSDLATSAWSLEKEGEAILRRIRG